MARSEQTNITYPTYLEHGPEVGHAVELFLNVLDLLVARSPLFDLLLVMQTGRDARLRTVGLITKRHDIATPSWRVGAELLVCLINQGILIMKSRVGITKLYNITYRPSLGWDVLWKYIIT